MVRRQRQLEPADSVHQRMLRAVRSRCDAHRKQNFTDDEAAWADLRQAVARGEITREELLTGYAAEPVRLTIGDTRLEIGAPATIREVPTIADSEQSTVIPFPERP